jgi:hypothetical protein
VQFMVSLYLSVANVGLPRIAAGLGFSTLGLTFGSLLLFGGKGRRPVGHRGVQPSAWTYRYSDNQGKP